MAINYIRINNPWFLEQDNEGRPAAGYLVYTLVAGSVDTLADTYSDRELTAKNTNPIVLNNRGQANIYSNTYLKLVYCAPGGDLSSPIWTQDYVGEEQQIIPLIGSAVGTSYNRYRVNVVPGPAALTDGLELFMIPDIDSLATLVTHEGHSIPTEFTGLGINDGLFSGPYTGTVPGAIFTVEIDSAWGVPPVAPTAVDTVDAGVVDAGEHRVAITFVTAEGESVMGVPSAIVNAAGNKTIDVSDIPVSPNQKVIARNIYMTTAGGSIYYLAGSISDNVTTAFTINISDATLVGGTTAPTEDTTGVKDTFTYRKDAAVLGAGIEIDGNNALQELVEGVGITFAADVGHTIGDLWQVEVMTPATLNLNDLGDPTYQIIYKNVGGELRALDKGDIKALIPATLVYSVGLKCWILNNPSTAAAEAPAIATRIRKEITADYQMTPDDAGNIISCTGSFTVTLPTAPEGANKFFYVKNKSNGSILIDAQGYQIFGYGHDGPTLFTLANQLEAVQLQSNGIDWEIISMVVGPTIYTPGGVWFTQVGDNYWTCPVGTYSITVVKIIGGGGGGAGGANFFDPGGYGGRAGQVVLGQVVPVVPGTQYRFYVGAGGAGTEGRAGYDGGNSTIWDDATPLLIANGGAGGIYPVTGDPPHDRAGETNGSGYGGGGEGRGYPDASWPYAGFNGQPGAIQITY